jgi:hypothetical protein
MYFKEDIIMKKFKQVLSIAMVLVLAMSMFTLFASATGVNDPITEIPVSKIVKVTQKGTLLPTETFHISMVPATADELYTTDSEGKQVPVTDSNKQKVESGPALSDSTLTFTFTADDNTETGSVTKSDVFKMQFAVPDGATTAFDHTGVYRYYITEQEARDADGNEVKNGYIDYDTSKYVIDLYVDQNSKGEFVVINYVASIEGKDSKPNTISFTNTISCSTLKILKTVEGTEYKQGELYTFQLLIPIGGKDKGTTIVLEDGYTFDAEIYNTKGKVTDVEGGRTDDKGIVKIKVAGDDINADMDTYATTFQLKADEYLQINGVPVTMVYKVQEVVDSEDFQKQGYTVTHTYEEYGTNNTATRTTDKVEEKDGNVVTGVINTLSNTVTIINTRNIDVPNSGITLDVLPYVLILTVALCGVLLLVISKKKRAR